MKRKKQFYKNNFIGVFFVGIFLLAVISRGFAKSNFPKFVNEALAVTGTLNLNTSGSTFTPGGIWKSDGTVGIGTTAPVSAAGFSKVLEIYDPSSSALQVNSGGTYKAEFGVSSSGGWAGTETNHAMRFVTNSTEQMRITNTGNVGIGTTAPGDKLMVAGTASGSNMAGITISNLAGKVVNSGSTLNFGYDAAGHEVAAIIATVTDATNVNGDLQFQNVYNSGYNNTVMIKSSGNVGIGTTGPAAGTKLEVAGTIYSGTYTQPTAGNGLYLHGNGGGNMYAYDYSGGTGYKPIGISGNTISLNTDTWSASPALFINASRKVGIGTTAPGGWLDVHGAGGEILLSNMTNPGGFWSDGGSNLYIANWATASGLNINTSNGAVTIDSVKSDAFYHYVCANANGTLSSGHTCNVSSIRYKENIRPIDNALEIVNKLKGVNFTWKPQYGGYKDIGFIAEEVGKIYPQLVDWEANGIDAKGLQYDKLTAVLAEAVKEQQTEIVSLQSITTDFISKFKAGLIETKKLIVDGVDILKKLNELSVKVESQQKQIEELQKTVEELKK